MKYEFRHQFTNVIIHAENIPDDSPNPVRTALEQAALAGAYLARAYLAGANLAGANLAGAYLARANLEGANLAGANLAGAYLARAYLAGANLAGADLARADLEGANLPRADLEGANLEGANLARAYLAGARNLPASTVAVDPPYHTIASRAERAHRYRIAHPDIPVVEQLDARILDAITAGGTLYMGAWHFYGECGTSHCRAGWAIHLAGNAGYELERKLGSSERAGAQIYLASVGFIPWFYASDEQAMLDIRRCAAEQISKK